MEDDLIDGIVKILYHGIEHLDEGTNFDLQIAMVSIDNSVELAMKCYLGIREFIKFDPLIKKLKQKNPNLFTESFYKDIKEFHLIRNEIYHVIKEKKVKYFKTALYASLAKKLISKLFSRHIQALFRKEDHISILVDEFMDNWHELIGNLIIIYGAESEIFDPSYHEEEVIEFAKYNGIINSGECLELLNISRIRDHLKKFGIIDDLKMFEKSIEFLKKLRKLTEDIVDERYSPKI